MDLKGGPEGRMLQDVSHGGHTVVPEKGKLGEAREVEHDITSVQVLEAPHGPYSLAEFCDGTTPFDYVFEDLAADAGFADSHLPSPTTAEEATAVVAALKALADAMVEQDPAGTAGTSSIPAVYTYWGQFIDHDLTANTDRDADISDIRPPDLRVLDPDHVRANLRNLRQPTLNLDAVYGAGPDDPESAALYDGARLRVGRVSTAPGIPGVLIPPDDDLDRDLPRAADKKAVIADARNDENLIVAQLHLAFLRFHNAVVDWVEEHDDDCRPDDTSEVFRRARRLTEWQYQWLVVHDYLKTVTRRGVVDDVLANPDERFDPRDDGPYMPLEFSVAAFRFGHSMVRGGYDHNRNFGSPGLNVAPFASLNDLFTFTGSGGFRGGDVLPFNWIIEWNRFVDKGDTNPAHFARKIDTAVAPPLLTLQNEANDQADERIKAMLKNLAHRNLLRGYHLAIPTGQAVAAAMGVEPLAADQLAEAGSAVATALDAGGFVERTPLWYYLLREAEVQARGNTLGELGSRIVCQTIIGQVRNDPTSFLSHDEPWTPDQGVKLADGTAITSISQFLRFAGVMS